MLIFKLLSVLLDYPSNDMLDELRQETVRAGSAFALASEVDPDRCLPVEDHHTIAGFIDHLLALDSSEAQALYVQTFDLTPEHSLHLTHHIFGEEKTRGPALIDLTEYLKSYGFMHDEKELPDYLPLMLEFAAELEPDESRVFLGDTSKVLGVIAGNLSRVDSPYARLIKILNNYGSLVKLAA